MTMEPIDPIALPQRARKPRRKEPWIAADLDWQKFLHETQFDIWGPPESHPDDKPRDKFKRA